MSNLIWRTEFFLTILRRRYSSKHTEATMIMEYANASSAAAFNLAPEAVVGLSSSIRQSVYNVNLALHQSS